MRALRSPLFFITALSLGACGGGQARTARIEASPAPETGGVVVETPRAPGRTRRAQAGRAAPAAECPESDSSVFVLRYDPQRGTLETAHPGAYPVGGQRIVVCVTNPDWRDVYSVTTSETVESADLGAASTEFTVGDIGTLTEPAQSYSSQRVERSETPPEGEGERSETPPEGAEAQTETRAGQVAAPRGGQVRCADTIARGAVFLETHRSNFMRRMVNILSGPVGPEQVDALREALDNYRYPREPQREGPSDGTSFCPPNAVEGGARCSLESFVNHAFLPSWLWIADGEWLFNEAAFQHSICGQAAATDPSLAGVTPASPLGPGLPPSIRPAVGALARSLERVAGVADLAEALLADVEQPEAVFDLGTFGGNSLAIITVARHRRTLILRNGRARLEWRARRTMRRQEVHAISTFRLEPGFAFSLLRRPTFGVENTPNADQVIALRDEGLRLVEPAVFVSFYWCGQDLRVNPWERNCQGHEGDPGWWILAHLPSITIGIPISAELVTERASFFVGLLLDWIPYVSIGVGAHIGLSVPTLREGVLLGDPLAGRALEELVENRPQISGYLSLSMSIDAFQQLAGFQVQR